MRGHQRDEKPSDTTPRMKSPEIEVEHGTQICNTKVHSKEERTQCRRNGEEDTSSEVAALQPTVVLHGQYGAKESEDIEEEVHSAPEVQMDDAADAVRPEAVQDIGSTTGAESDELSEGLRLHRTEGSNEHAV